MNKIDTFREKIINVSTGLGISALAIGSCCDLNLIPRDMLYYSWAGLTTLGLICVGMEIGLKLGGSVDETLSGVDAKGIRTFTVLALSTLGVLNKFIL